MHREWLKMADGASVFTYMWIPSEIPLRGIVQIIHGMAEHALRYEEFALQLNEQGYAVVAHDQRGHGQTAHSVEQCGVLLDCDYAQLLDDIKSVRSIFSNRVGSSLPVIVFGHSMGSFLALRDAQLHPNDRSALALSASTGKPSPSITLGMLIADFQMGRGGTAKKSNLLYRLLFGAFNKKFSPNRTDFDWLSRDTHEVDTYIADPYCGFVCTAHFYYGFFDMLVALYARRNLAKLNKATPIYLMYGDQDPVGQFGKGSKRLLKTLKNSGIQRIDENCYEGSRHELLQELNRKIIIDKFMTWLYNI